jgi:hypothetical protein
MPNKANFWPESADGVISRSLHCSYSRITLTFSLEV